MGELAEGYQRIISQFHRESGVRGGVGWRVLCGAVFFQKPD